MCLPLKLFRSWVPNVFKRNYDQIFECSCDICGTIFPTMNELITHMGYHTTEQINRRLEQGYGTVRCNKCFRSFTSVAVMTEHSCVKIQKPTSSVICGLSPINSSNSLESVLIHDDPEDICNPLHNYNNCTETTSPS